MRRTTKEDAMTVSPVGWKDPQQSAWKLAAGLAGVALGIGLWLEIYALATEGLSSEVVVNIPAAILWSGVALMVATRGRGARGAVPLSAFLTLGSLAYSAMAAEAVYPQSVLWVAFLPLPEAVLLNDAPLRALVAALAVAALVRVSGSFAGGATLRFTGVAAVASPLVRSARSAWPWMIASVALYGGLLFFVLGYIQPAWVEPLRSTWRWVFRPAFGLLAALTVLLSLAVQHQQAAPEGRRRVLWLFLAVCLMGYLLALVSLRLPVAAITGVAPRTVYPAWFVATINLAQAFAVPSLFGLAILRSDVIDPRPLLRGSAVYGPLSLIAVFLAAAFGNAMAELFESQLGIEGLMGAALYGGGIAVILLPVRGLIRQTLDRVPGTLPWRGPGR